MPDRAFPRALFRACLVTLAVWSAWPGDGALAADSSSRRVNWRVLRVGAGGFVTGIDISPDGSVKLARTDTYGAYAWDQARQQWTQLVTARSMPPEDVGVDKDAGVYEIRVAPSRPSRLYMAYNGFVYRSDTGGVRWMRTGFARVPMDANDEFRNLGPKMAIDPADPDVVYVGTPQNGLLATADGGTTWRAVAGVPKGAPAGEGKFPGIAGLTFDAHSGAIAGRTRTIYAASSGHGVYRTTDAGATWTALTGGPRDVRRARVAKDGAYYAADADGASVWRYDGSGWRNITPGGASLRGASAKGTWATVVTDPFDAARVLAVRQSGSFATSADRGGAWADGPSEPRRQAHDIPWLAWTQESYMSVGDMLLDPATPDLLWFAEGIGVWRANVPSTRPAPVTFVSQSAGIEQLGANQILSPPGGKPVLASWDRPVFRIDNPDAFPATHGPDNQRAIVMGWALDYGSNNRAFIAGLFNWWGIEKSGFSTDGGQTWTPFPSFPPTTKNGKIGGDIAVASPLNMIWAPSNNASPYFTKDGGASWTPIFLPGVAREGDSGWSYAYYLNRRFVAADRVLPGAFYLYNYLKGLYRSGDGGASWTLVHPGEIAPYSRFNAKLRSVPAHAGHLFFTSGSQGGPADRHPAPNPFMRSVDGGTTWTPVEGALEVRAFGFGKGHGAYPAIYVAGWIHGDYGIWRSDDAAASWIKLGEFPLGILCHVTAIEGDGDMAGRVYVGFGGAGYVYGDEQK